MLYPFTLKVRLRDASLFHTAFRCSRKAPTVMKTLLVLLLPLGLAACDRSPDASVARENSPSATGRWYGADRVARW